MRWRGCQCVVHWKSSPPNTALVERRSAFVAEPSDELRGPSQLRRRHPQRAPASLQTFRSNASRWKRSRGGLF